ncbi:hypothetical protein QTP88_022689 [Uroleucon formosanum]
MDRKHGQLEKWTSIGSWSLKEVLRKIYDPVKDEITGKWRRRKNIELEILYGNVDILEVIRSRRLRWAGHAWRSQNPLLHAVMEQNPVGKRPLGRPRIRWEDVVKKDVEQLGGCSNWRNLALNREGWKLGFTTSIRTKMGRCDPVTLPHYYIVGTKNDAERKVSQPGGTRLSTVYILEQPD